MVPWQEVDPVVNSPFTVSRQTKIATAGSCFAQNISATLQRHGFNYYVVEPGSKRAAFDRQRSHYRSGYQPAAGLLNWALISGTLSL